MTTSEQINEIAAALAKAQATMKNATLNKVNPHFKSKYADLAGIRDAVIPALTANGIAVVQTLDAASEGVAYCVLTRLLHTSGQWIESLCPIPSAPDMQKMGSAITYARRYSLSAICGIAADEDDDANEASTPTQEVAKGQPYDEWMADLAAAADEGHDSLMKAVTASRADYKNKLRADKTTWKLLEDRSKKKVAD